MENQNKKGGNSQQQGVADNTTLFSNLPMGYDNFKGLFGWRDINERKRKCLFFIYFSL